MILRRYGGSGKTTGPRPNAGTAESAGQRDRGQELVDTSGALEAISQRGIARWFRRLRRFLDDAKDDVRFAAAACVLHLSEIPAEKTPAEPAKP